MAELEGTNVGPYEIKILLGAGGMGQVYRAHDPRLEREVAIKVLSAALAHEPGYLERFRREARAVAKLNHPHIVPVYDFGEQGDLTYLVMPLISGGTLREYLAQRHILPLSEVVSVTEQVAGALQYAHERGLVHRDVKPANILISDEGRALLSDFGIVRLVQKEDAAATLTSMGAFVGSPEYAAPEMVLSKTIDHRVDIYALGVILFQMLTGQLPFTGVTSVSLLMMQAQQPPPLPRSLNPAIPLAVEAVILKALAKAPVERYQTMTEFQAALRAASVAPSDEMTYVSPPTTGEIGDLPTVVTYGLPPAPGSGPAAFPPAGPRSEPPPVWGEPGSGPYGWATPGSGPATMPPLPPTYATGLAVLPNQAPVIPPPPRRRRILPILLLLLALVVIAAGGTTLAVGASLGLFKGGTASRATPKPTTLPAGIITEFAVPTSPSHLYELTSGPDGALWFAEYEGNRIGHITPDGHLNEFPFLPTSNSGPVVLTTGPDGALWFTEWHANKIGRISLDGHLNEFDIPTPGSIPEGITSGPDGNLWFAETTGSKIGRITPNGDFAEFPLSSPGAHPSMIIKGPDNALWFSEYGANKIGRITPDGKSIREFPISTPDSHPRGMTIGPDGNLWFTEAAGNKIGRISLDGQRVDEFPLPNPKSQPFQITTGRDGNLWFTEYDSNKIGRITPDGQHIDEYALPEPLSAPAGITTGPDGNLWFTEASGNKIGRITSGA
ncbi:MAG TPA: protein kinase [Ktedonobacterales bacterium]